MNLFRKFLLDNAQEFGITKPELLAIKERTEKVKTRESKTNQNSAVEKRGRLMQRQYQQTEDTINFFLNEYEAILNKNEP